MLTHVSSSYFISHLCLFYFFVFFILFFFFNDTATTEIYTLSLHDALPISVSRCSTVGISRRRHTSAWSCGTTTPLRPRAIARRSEEHTSELQSQFHLGCRLLLEKKKKKKTTQTNKE